MEAIKNICLGACGLAVMLLYLAFACMMAAFPVLIGFWLWGKIL